MIIHIITLVTECAQIIGDSSLPSGDVLIKYTYLLGLKKIILSYWHDFNYIFNDKMKFEDNIDRLNLIRREESHNRIITPTQLTELENIYKYLATLIESQYPNIIPKFLVENWRTEMTDIVQDISDNMEDADEKDRYNVQKMSSILNQHKELYIEAIQKLDNLITPSGKEELTEKLEEILRRSADALFQMIEGMKVMSKSSVDVAYENYSRCMSDIKKFERDYLLSEL